MFTDEPEEPVIKVIPLLSPKSIENAGPKLLENIDTGTFIGVNEFSFILLISSISYERARAEVIAALIALSKVPLVETSKSAANEVVLVTNPNTAATAMLSAIFFFFIKSPTV